MKKSLSAHIPDAELTQAERVVTASISKLSHRVGVLSDEERRRMEHLRSLLDEIRVRLGQSVSPSGRLLISDSGARKTPDLKPSTPFPIANPSAVLDLGRDASSGVAFRVDLSRG